jgi:hypothetical protein
MESGREYMNSFISQYAEDFNRLDASAISSWYEFPLSILTPQGNSIFNSVDDFTHSLEKLLDVYRSFKFSHAKVVKETISEGLHGLNQVDVLWGLVDQQGKAIIEFDISYFFKEKEGNTILCGIVSHNEFTEWQTKLKLAKS